MKFYASLKLSENIQETPEGFLLCLNVPIARIGEMVYASGETPIDAGPDGKVIISRSEKEVFAPETIASFEGKPLTIQHPEDFVNPKNWSELANGHLQNVRRGEGEEKDDLVADILVTSAKAIELVKSGLREVSCGYEAEYKETARGKGEQLNIIGNHVALVDQGRAGAAYAIRDHKENKGVSRMTKIQEKLKTLFAKTADEAARVIDEAEKGEEKKDESTDAMAMDELVKICKDLGEKVSALSAKMGSKEEKKADDASPVDPPVVAEEKVAADAEVAPGLEDRLKAIEAKLAQLLEGEAVEAEMGDEELEEGAEEFVGDADKEEEKKEMTGDTASRAEILAPGIKLCKDVKAKALKAAYGTKDGKAVIESLTGGKAPAFDSADKVETLFIAASEVLKASRENQLSKTKMTRDFMSHLGVKAGAMTPEKINEINAAKYGSK